MFAILGLNGAGKSTLINILSGLTLKNSGSVKINGYDIDKKRKEASCQIGVVPQEINFDPFLGPSFTNQEIRTVLKQRKINSVILRFFNVCSAFSKPCIGELHNPETHLIPTIIYKAIYNKKVYIYGNNFPTKDGTCIRDYIHIKDICLAIEKSIKLLGDKKNSTILNIGNHKGLSNQEIINYVKKNVKKKINLNYVNRRKGDVVSLVCNSEKAKNLLSWRAKNSNLQTIVRDEIKWIKKINKLKIKRKFKNYNI